MLIGDAFLANNKMLAPKIIAFVGHPKAGKTTAAELLRDNYGYNILDTGLPLRKIAMDYLGLSKDQVFTQEGKASYVEIAGKRRQVRDILGSLGRQLEDLFGEEIMPIMSHNSIATEQADWPIIDPSCRKAQGHYWKRAGGVVLGIRAPAVGPSPYAFDTFDETCVDYWIENDALSKGLAPLEAKLNLLHKLNRAILTIVPQIRQAV